MAGETRTATHAVELGRRLEEKPFRYDFYQAVRRLEAAHRDLPRFGTSLRLRDDPIRLAQEPSLAFAPSTIASFKGKRGGRAPILTVFFFGMFGPNGPLPLHLTEYARSRLRNEDDPTFSRFLDVFHHRFLSLFYRAWANGQPAVCFDRPEEDRFGTYVASICGLGMKGLRDRDDLPDLYKLHMAGRLAAQTRHPEGLRALLSGFFQLPVEINEFVGQWLELPYRSRCRLGESPDTGTLGTTAIVGSRMWECQLKFRIRCGPMSYQNFSRLLPNAEGDSMKRLISIVKNYIGEELDWDVNLVLKKEEVPPLMLGSQGRLGLTTWLRGQPMERDADQLVLDPLRAAG